MKAKYSFFGNNTAGSSTLLTPSILTKPLVRVIMILMFTDAQMQYPIQRY